MIKHIVMYKLNEATYDNAIALRDKFLAMQGQIEELISIDSGVDVLRLGRSFDVVLICEFNTLEDMDNYQNHPKHIVVKDYVKNLVECSHSVDYEF